ncbi:MAG TPA: deoxyguanosinetriphosphate triphosphohydrolase [Bdellovibrionota bacterium]|nr:deoxyguanosinetriphosphate triphosphohydrolase [Bdellovibrionota bacterium]
MLLREQLEQLEKERLAPVASLAISSRGRRYKEEKPRFRTDFQRDRDRIIHSAAFRRMEYKTQVFVNHEGDHYRTRLTHSLEVAQIARTVARNLELNEDLTEALVLSHDIGHTPFGHSGERAMTALMKEYGGFEHNQQSLRVVDYLERRYPTFKGLNLTFEVREGIVKHSSHWTPDKVPSDLEPALQPGLEAQLIDYVDEIAYNNHDVDDGLSSQMIEPEALEQAMLWKSAFEKTKAKHPKLTLFHLKHMTISAMITILVEDLITQTDQNIRKAGLESLADVHRADKSLAGFSKEISKQNQQLKKFLWDHLYTHYRVVRMEEKARRMLTDLFHAYRSRPEQLPREFVDRMQEEPVERIICDYIAGMTDRFALDEHQKLFDPHTRV